MPAPLSEIVVTSDDANWDTARRAFNLAIDQQPEFVAIPRDAAEVAAVVRFAAERGMGVAPQGGGHAAGSVGSLDHTVLLRTGQMRDVAIDGERRSARVAGGTLWGDVVPTAAAHGLAALHGTASDVTVAGYTLGGGVSWYGRKHGLASNRVTAVELVTADGEFHRVSAKEDGELFWALRGGGGNFGVVTAIEFDLLPIGEVYAGALFFPFEQAAESLHLWRRWTASVPREMASLWRLMRFPDALEVPDPMRGKTLAIIEAVLIGSVDQGDEMLAPLRDRRPCIDTFELRRPDGLAGLHMDPAQPIPYAGTHTLLDDLPDDAIDRLVTVLSDESGATMLSFEVRHLGGALLDPPEGAGALATVPGLFSTFGGGLTADPKRAALMKEGFASIDEALRGNESGLFANFSSGRFDPSRFFDPGTVRRLGEVRARVDPEGVFRASHPVAPVAVGTSTR